MHTIVQLESRKGKNNWRDFGMGGRMVGSVRMCLRGAECEGIDWIQLLPDTVQCRTLVKTVMNLRSINGREFRDELRLLDFEEGICCMELQMRSSRVLFPGTLTVFS
jgi:hypothetical protein